MRRSWMIRATLPSFALGLILLSGCDNAFTGPDARLPEDVQNVTSLAVGAQDSVLAGGYVLVRSAPEDATDGVGGLGRVVGSALRLVDGVIDLSGGALALQENRLVVPDRAVFGPTVFRMELLPSSYIMVELTATRGGQDVGSLGFARNVTVTLSYANTRVSDPSRLLIVRVNENGRHERMPSVVDTVNQTVSAQLDHFSKYAMASN